MIKIKKEVTKDKIPEVLQLSIGQLVTIFENHDFSQRKKSSEALKQPRLDDKKSPKFLINNHIEPLLREKEIYSEL